MDTLIAAVSMYGERNEMLMMSFRVAHLSNARFRAALAFGLLGLLITVAVADAAESEATAPKTAREAHLALLQEDRFPSAGSCRTCHPDHYRQWSTSPHAYAQMSVVFQSMHAAVVTLTNGTNGDFCIRCHTPVGMNLGEPAVLENEKRHPTSREGITCIACHRVSENYGRISGRFPLVEAPLCEPVYGPSGNAEGVNEEVARVLADPNIRVAGCDEAGRTIHETSEQRVFLTESGFCGACHDVSSPSRDSAVPATTCVSSTGSGSRMPSASTRRPPPLGTGFLVRTATCRRPPA
jgi:nitrate/TMAO reductase-like tetraheme cytochrome c subunit